MDIYMSLSSAALSAIGVVCALYALHRLGIYSEERGWIYYRRAGTGMSRALLEIQSFVEPEKQHVMAAQDHGEHQGREEDDEGDGRDRRSNTYPEGTKRS